MNKVEANNYNYFKYTFNNCLNTLGIPKYVYFSIRHFSALYYTLTLLSCLKIYT